MSIKETKLFLGIRKDLLEEIYRDVIEETHEKGAFVFLEDDPAGFFYILQEGRLRLSVGGRGRIAYILSRPGDVFGWSGLVDRATYTVSAECLAPTRVSKLQGKRLDEILERDPASGLVFFRGLARLIDQRLVGTYRMLVSAYGGKGPASYG